MTPRRSLVSVNFDFFWRISGLLNVPMRILFCQFWTGNDHCQANKRIQYNSPK